MGDFERRLRESLHARADDVEPAPHLWQEVRARHDRRRRMRWLVATAGAATVALVAALVVPALTDLDRGTPDVLVDPTADPSEPAPTGTTMGPPPLAVVTDGRVIRLVRPGTTQVFAVVHEQPAEGESTIEAVAIRPGSTPDDFAVVWLSAAEGMWDLRWTDESGELRRLADDGYGISSDATDVTGSVAPAPVFSPDGRHLAWAEEGDDAPLLRTIGWTDDGPGTGDRADDNASFGLDGLDAVPTLRLDDWSWDDDVDGRRGTIWASDGTPQAYTIAVEVQGDGALALPPSAVAPYAAERPVADIGAHDGRVWLLSLAGAGEGTVEAEIEVDGHRHALPDDLRRTTDPSGLWMSVSADHAVVGLGGRGYLIDRSGEQTPIDGQVVAAAFTR